ncbi:MAG TPA: ABC transporter substrate-binding protein, partial [Dehalococcoidia bacterium]|nr:ABC transporter substrate-binding protein [Dehalococcoidia bacterium]
MFGTPRRLLVNLLIVGVAAFVLACGGGSSKGSSGAAGSSDSGNSNASANADLRLPGADPITLDPALASDADSATYIVEIFSGLVTISPKLDLQLDLAQSVDVSKDGKTYTFKLRDNAVFQDGRKVTADDVKWSLERAS